MNEALIQDLQRGIRGEIKTDPETLSAHSRDGSIFSITPKMVVFPRTIEDIKRLVRLVNLANKENQSLSLAVRSGGTDTTGGPLGESIVVNLNQHFNQIKLDATKLVAEAEAGALFSEFTKELPAELILPAYSLAKNESRFGGIIMNGSTSEKSLRYGGLDNFINSVDMILADGEEVRFEKLTREQVKEKMTLQTHEGSIYRQIIPLLERHLDLINTYHPKTSSNSAGYGLWRVWNREDDTFDLTNLISGSQGTLGIMTRASVALQRKKPHRILIPIFARQWSDLPKLVNSLLPHGLEALDLYDEVTLKVCLRYKSEFVKYLNKKGFGLFMPEHKHRLRYKKLPKFTVLAELAEDDISTLNSKLAQIQKIIVEQNLSYLSVTDAATYEKYWSIRHYGEDILRKHLSKNVVPAAVADFCLPLQELDNFISQLSQLLKADAARLVITGQIGAGHLSISLLTNTNNSKDRQKVLDLVKTINELVWNHGGTISAENNDGIMRTPFIERQYGDSIYKIFREVKRIFDPNNIFNPGKKIGISADVLEQLFIPISSEKK